MPAERLSLSRHGESLTFEEVIDRWQNDDSFVDAFSAMLSESRYEAFRWETPPISSTTLTRAFECVLWNAPTLTLKPDEHTFGEHFARAAGEGAVSFLSLGKKSVLIAPLPSDDNECCASLGPFLRRASAPRIRALWQTVGEATRAFLGERPCWLSTAGDAVAWLHVRLDTAPKYYYFQPYFEE